MRFLAEIITSFRESDTADQLTRAARRLAGNAEEGQRALDQLREATLEGQLRVVGTGDESDFEKAANARRLELAAYRAVASGLLWLVGRKD